MSKEKFENYSDYTGIVFVVDREKNEFWLFKNDGGESFVHGKIGEGADINFNTMKFTGHIFVENIPFSSATYASEKVESILAQAAETVSKTNVETKEQLPSKSEIKERKRLFNFKVFDIEKHTSLDAPPNSLSRNAKKKWHAERKRYLEAIGKSEKEPTVTILSGPVERPDIPEEPAPIDNPTPIKNDTPVQKPVEAPKEPVAATSTQTDTPVDPLVEKARGYAQNAPKSNVDNKPVKHPFGPGNVRSILKDHLESYFIGFSKTVDGELTYVPLCVLEKEDPELPFFVFSDQRTAEFMLKKMSESKAYSYLIKDSKIYPATAIFQEDWDLPVVVMKNVVGYFTKDN